MPLGPVAATTPAPALVAREIEHDFLRGGPDDAGGLALLEEQDLGGVSTARAAAGGSEARRRDRDRDLGPGSVLVVVGRRSAARGLRRRGRRDRNRDRLARGRGHVRRARGDPDSSAGVSGDGRDLGLGGVVEGGHAAVLVDAKHEAGAGRARPDPAHGVDVESADVRVRGGVHGLALATLLDAVDLPGKPRRDVQIRSGKRQGPDVLGFRVVVERGLALLDAVDLPARRAARVDDAVRPEGDGRDLLLGKRGPRLHRAAGRDPEDLARVARADEELPVLALGRDEEHGFRNPLDFRERAARHEGPVRGHRDAAGLSLRELRGAVRRPDLDRRRGGGPRRQDRRGSGHAHADREREGGASRPGHQSLGSTSRWRRAEPARGTGCSIDSACSLR